MRDVQLAALAVLLLCAPLQADNDSDHAGLLGSWQQQEDSGRGVVVWVFEQKGMDLQITESIGDRKISEFECAPEGKECEGTDEGKKAKVSMYYDGPALVQFETAGSEVTKRRFAIASQPDVMEIEVMPIVGGDKAETLHLKRMKLSSKNQ
jgi:hypothetical protein